MHDPAYCPTCVIRIPIKGQEVKPSTAYECPSCHTTWITGGVSRLADLVRRAADAYEAANTGGNVYRQQVDATLASAMAILAVCEHLTKIDAKLERIAAALEGRKA